MYPYIQIQIPGILEWQDCFAILKKSSFYEVYASMKLVTHIITQHRLTYVVHRYPTCHLDDLFSTPDQPSAHYMLKHPLKYALAFSAISV